MTGGEGQRESASGERQVAASDGDEVVVLLVRIDGIGVRCYGRSVDAEVANIVAAAAGIGELEVLGVEAIFINGGDKADLEGRAIGGVGELYLAIILVLGVVFGARTIIPAGDIAQELVGFFMHHESLSVLIADQVGERHRKRVVGVIGEVVEIDRVIGVGVAVKATVDKAAIVGEERELEGATAVAAIVEQAFVGYEVIAGVAPGELVSRRRVVAAIALEVKIAAVFERAQRLSQR